VDDVPVSVHTLRMFLPCRYRTWIIAWAAVAWIGRVCAASQASSAESIDFNRDIRPIFSENCYACHGPDEGKRKAGLRLDVEGDAFKELKSGKHALIPGDTSQSTLITRIKTTDLDEVMPPPKSGKSLSPEQIGKLTRWVEQGAKWKNHWSFIPPERPPLPQVKD
jgi:mono/diheme cytochrome c family protein